MKLRHPGLIRLAAFLGAILVRLWMGTLRCRFDFRASGVHPVDPKKQRFIYAFWHESILTAVSQRFPLDVLISHHADGELIAQIAEFLGFGTVRGSTTRGGAEGLLGMMGVDGNRHLGVTPDGPRGPRRQVQLGLIFLASRTGLPIVLCGAGCQNAWRARSWDKLAIPKPFSTVCWVISAPIHVPAKLNRPGMEQYRKLVEEQFLAVTQAAETWAQTGQRQTPQDHARPMRASA